MARQTRQRLDTMARKTRWAWLIATFFGAGHLRPGPGTYGSIAGALLWYAGAQALHPAHLALWTAAAALLAIAAGVPASTIVARESGREDPGHVVIDEVAGQLIALIAIRPDWSHTLVSLLLFRVFDILKPPPIRWLEALPGGWGIMLDDVAAGLLALLCAHVAQHFFP